MPPHQVYFQGFMELLLHVFKHTFLVFVSVNAQSPESFSGAFNRKYFILPYTLGKYNSNIISKVPHSEMSDTHNQLQYEICCSLEIASACLLGRARKFFVNVFCDRLV